MGGFPGGETGRTCIAPMRDQPSSSLLIPLAQAVATPPVWSPSSFTLCLDEPAAEPTPRVGTLSISHSIGKDARNRALRTSKTGYLSGPQPCLHGRHDFSAFFGRLRAPRTGSCRCIPVVVELSPLPVLALPYVQEGLGQHAKSHMPVPTRPIPHLVLVQSNRMPGFFAAFMGGRLGAYQPDQIFKSGSRRAKAGVEVQCLPACPTPSHQQPTARARVSQGPYRALFHSWVGESSYFELIRSHSEAGLSAPGYRGYRGRPGMRPGPELLSRFNLEDMRQPVGL